MTATVAYPHIVKTADRSAHLERIPRIRVAQVVMDYLSHGWSPEEMCRQHPYLTIAEAHAAMLYYWDHQEEIDAEIFEEEATAQAEGIMIRHCGISRRIRDGKSF